MRELDRWTVRPRHQDRGSPAHDREDHRHRRRCAPVGRVLIIDEAERLTPTALELLRDRHDREHLAIILIGMPGIDPLPSLPAALQSPRLRPPLPRPRPRRAPVRSRPPLEAPRPHPEP
ncbi:AAA family ATPase [Clavibacter tessellarius]|uniref:AAA family ATPase n=1 Tax=Clavibacter tessellarius TaxID=31965 RepID=UPI0039BFA0B3